MDVEIAIVGGGIVGLTSALRLAEAGRKVLVSDRQADMLSASAGNAGTIAAYNCVPIANPGVLRGLPRLQLDRDSPFLGRAADAGAVAGPHRRSIAAAPGACQRGGTCCPAA